MIMPNCVSNYGELDELLRADDATWSVICRRLRPVIEATLFRVLGARD